MVRGTREWDAPTPVPEWVARDVVGHLVEWFPGFLESGSGIRLPGGPSVDEDPVGAWEAHADAVQAVLDDPATVGRRFSDPHTGDLPLDQAVDRFYTADVFMHTWDLARASGQDETLDADLCAELLAGMESVEELIRSSGQYGPRVPVADAASAQDRMLGFIGRDPAWQRPRRAGGSALVGRAQGEADRVDAVALVGRGVVALALEDVPEVAAARGAAHLDARATGQRAVLERTPRTPRRAGRRTTATRSGCRTWSPSANSSAPQARQA